MEDLTDGDYERVRQGEESPGETGIVQLNDGWMDGSWMNGLLGGRVYGRTDGWVIYDA